AGDVERAAEPLRGAGKRDRGERANVVYRDLLEAAVGRERSGERAGEDGVPHARPVLHEEDRPEDGVRQVQLADVLLDAPLALEVREPGLACALPTEL